MLPLLKYPRTTHLEGSRWQPGDEELDGVPYSLVAGRYLVVEEKLDGANSAVSFDEDAELWLQSRGHYLTGGGRERHFALLKTWAQVHRQALWERLGRRYVMYGEWLYAKHTIFYDQLPHYFLEFDVYDRETGTFLDTAARRALLEGGPVRSVPVLWEGHAAAENRLPAMVKHSLYKSERHRERLREIAAELGLDPVRSEKETDPSDLSEGLYLKLESEGTVRSRFKFVRASFLTSVANSESHWLERPILPNQLAPEVDLFAC
jgi:hypothetical protein